MAETIVDGEFFHVTRDVHYNQHPPLAIGTLLKVGGKSNPFFGFYEGVLRYPVTTGTEVEQIPAIKFLKRVLNGEVNCPGLPQIAVDVAQHYLKLAREIIMEQVP